MSNGSSSSGLHLPDLSITGFRGIKCLSIPRLGHVTLLAGRNGVGKTTVLEAVRVYAARGHSAVLNALLEQREEFSSALDEDHDAVDFPDFTALFYGRKAERDQAISIGPSGSTDNIRIAVSSPSDWQPEQMDLFAGLAADSNLRALKIVFQEHERLLPWVITQDDFITPQTRRQLLTRLRHRQFEEGAPSPVECGSLGPGIPSNQLLAKLWDKVALTEDEDRAIEALRLVQGNGIERVAVVGDHRSHYSRARRTVVKLSDQPSPVPLKSLGDGATRVFGVALALANSRNGFLVIDEAENGIHHSIQEDFWHMILRTASRNNVQVLATTHSWDCVTGFARASHKLEDVEGVLLRLERGTDEVRAVEYSEDDLYIASDQHIEVR